jgi:hypothetical protein
MRFTLFFLILLSVAFSCQENKTKVIDISERTPKSDRDYEDRDSVEVSYTLAGQLATFQSWIPAVDSIRMNEEKHFLMRFQPVRSDNFVLYLASGDSLHYDRWVYPDSVITNSAFYNWLDRTGLSYFGAKENISKEAFAMLLTDTVLMRLNGFVDFNMWESLIEDQDWMNEGDYWIKQRKFGKAQWYVRKEDEFKKLPDQ